MASARLTTLRLALVALGACLAVACTVHAGKPGKEERLLDKALALLDQKDTKSICLGANMLGDLGRAEGIEPLLGHLRTRDEIARECVRDALGKLDVAPVLLAMWASDDAATKAKALEHAVALPHPGLMAIHREAAKDADPARRKRVATGLRRQVETPEVLALLGALVADPDKDVRWWAIDTLGLSKTAGARALLAARKDVEPEADLKVFIARALEGTTP